MFRFFKIIYKQNDSEKFKDKNYHINKVNKSLEKGIQLIHIWEDVWDNQTDMIKEKIINLIEKHT